MDEQSFEDLLAAAYTVQEHNDGLKRSEPTGMEAQVRSEIHAAPEASRYCQHCGSLKASEESRCLNCGQDEFRPGERMQRKWASMWLMSQERGLWPERPAEAVEAAPNLGESAPDIRDGPRETVPPFASEQLRHQPAGDGAAHDNPTRESAWNLASPVAAGLADEASAQPAHLAARTFSFSANEDSFLTDGAATDTAAMAEAMTTDPALAPSLKQRLAVTLRIHRSDLYLGAAVFLAALALLWPAVGTPQHAALGPMDRALIALGIAEAPAPVVHLPGDPGIEVWVDPHTALYYCPGEELYGKTADGRVSTQHEAQMDRFQPAERAPCE